MGRYPKKPESQLPRRVCWFHGWPADFFKDSGIWKPAVNTLAIGFD